MPEEREKGKGADGDRNDPDPLLQGPAVVPHKTDVVGSHGRAQVPQPKARAALRRKRSAVKDCREMASPLIPIPATKISSKPSR